MAALRCGGGASAYMTAPRITAPQNGDGRFGILTARARIRELPLRTVSCSVGSPPRAKRRCFQNKGVPEGCEALKAAAADMFRPLRLNLSEMRSLNTVYDLQDYQIGMLFGAFVGCVGCYQLWRAAPPIFVDAALGYTIYKLSVVSSELHRLRKSNSLITRLKFGIYTLLTELMPFSFREVQSRPPPMQITCHFVLLFAIIHATPFSRHTCCLLNNSFNAGFILFMALKDFKNKYVLLDAVRLPLFLLYLGAFMFDVAGLKKYGRRILISFVNHLKMRGGIREIFRIVWYPGYVSPYDDSLGSR
uniref:Uncharacterized protein n=1 Tax=Avena sativa TaxID=4498 RepID=A0ACD5Y0F2_AVESA